MGEVASVLNLTRVKGNTDADILAVINPPAADRDRNALVRHRAMPPVENWRHSSSIGAVLDMNVHSVISNFYRVICSNLPPRIFHYHVHVYRLLRDGSMDATDCAPDEDTRNLITVIISLRKRHPEWATVGGKKVGVAYDGKSALFTSAKLPFTLFTAENQAYFEEKVYLAKSDGSTSSRGYLVMNASTQLNLLTQLLGATHLDQ